MKCFWALFTITVSFWASALFSLDEGSLSHHQESQPTYLPSPKPLPLTLAPTLELNRTTQSVLLSREKTQPERNVRLMQRHVFPWNFVAGIAVLATFAGGLIYGAMRYGRFQRPPKVVTNPLDEAIWEVDRLEHEQLPLQKEFDSYYVHLTSIIRRYIELQMGIPASTQTTPEFLAIAVQDSHLNTESRQLLSDLLTYADQVKFARKPSTIADCTLALAYTREFFRQESLMDQSGLITDN